MPGLRSSRKCQPIIATYAVVHAATLQQPTESRAVIWQSGAWIGPECDLGAVGVRALSCSIGPCVAAKAGCDDYKKKKFTTRCTTAGLGLCAETFLDHAAGLQRARARAPADEDWPSQWR